MKRIIAAAVVLLVAGPANAADLLNTLSGGGLKDGPAAANTWTGYYVGAQGGYGWDSAVDLKDVKVGNVLTGTRPAGLFGGLSADAYWQASGIVFGLGTDINYANIADNSAVSASGTSLNSTIDWFGTVHARLGLPLGSNVLVYGTGGLAYGGVSTRAVTANTALSDSVGRVGWMAGAGSELKLSPGWAASFEWDHIDLGASSFSELVSGNGGTITQNNAFDIIKFGLHYKLGSDYVHPLN
jgi:outer membrane immunogenic protein